MQRLDSLEGLAEPGRGCLLAIGVFDGVHVGHRTILREMVSTGRASALRSVVVTFEPHPLEVLVPGGAPPRLTTVEGQAQLIAELGVDFLVTLAFDQAFAQMEPEQFVERYLVSGCRPRDVFVGYNFTFGAGGRGSADTLRDLGQRYGFEVRLFEPVVSEGLAVSSTLIRDVLRKGQVELAARLLGRPYHLSGQVVRGDGRGRAIGFPTANVEPEGSLLVPGQGVYAAWVKLDGRAHPAVVNSGRRPTFGGGPDRLEAHLLGFSGDVYGRPLEIIFIGRLRDETAYPGAEELGRQIESDVQSARQVLGLAEAR